MVFKKIYKNLFFFTLTNKNREEVQNKKLNTYINRLKNKKKELEGCKKKRVITIDEEVDLHAYEEAIVRLHSILHREEDKLTQLFSFKNNIENYLQLKYNALSNLDKLYARLYKKQLEIIDAGIAYIKD